MSDPKISVVVAAYNVEDYISETMDSLLGQVFPAHEILVINDGSTDGTLAILHAKYSGFSNVIVHTQGNQGVGAVRETGLKKATGDYIFFCDPDDLVSDKLFAAFRRAVVENNSIELFYFSKKSFVDSSQGRHFLRRNTAPSREGWFGHATELLEDLILSKKYKAATWQYIFKKTVTDHFEVSFKGRVHEDQLFSMNVYINARNCYATQSDLYFQRVRQGSLTNSLKNEAYVWAGYHAYREVVSLLKQNLSGFKCGQDVALIYMRGSVGALINSCVKNCVKLPAHLFSHTRENARDCDLGLRGGLVLLAPQVLFIVRRFRVRVRYLSRRLQGRSG
jgi:glycosyltransferase involved in cell wall biosynthesis